jgi:aspartyl-tRNA(Asn)/glutamyl-tRNA(Gln) amidotransferase subunit B
MNLFQLSADEIYAKTVSDEQKPYRIIAEIIDRDRENAVLYRSGRKQLLGYFGGEVMKSTDGKANPKLENEILRKHIDGT